MAEVTQRRYDWRRPPPTPLGDLAEPPAAQSRRRVPAQLWDVAVHTIGQRLQSQVAHEHSPEIDGYR
jgi:hypothetical protein